SVSLRPCAGRGFAFFMYQFIRCLPADYGNVVLVRSCTHASHTGSASLPGAWRLPGHAGRAVAGDVVATCLAAAPAVPAGAGSSAATQPGQCRATAQSGEPDP